MDQWLHTDAKPQLLRRGIHQIHGKPYPLWKALLIKEVQMREREWEDHRGEVVDGIKVRVPARVELRSGGKCRREGVILLGDGERGGRSGRRLRGQRRAGRGR